MTLALIGWLLAVSPPDAGATAVRERFKYEVPGGLDEAEVPGLMKSSGVPLRMRAVRSKKKLDELMDYFVDAFERDGLFLPADEAITAPLPHVTGYDFKKGITYSALFQTNGDGSVTVILSEAFVHARQSAAPFAPVFPGSTPPLDSESEGGRTLQYTTPAKAKEIEAFYREVMGKAGCREPEPLSFACAGKLNRVWVRERATRPTAVMVQQTDTPAGEAK